MIKYFAKGLKDFFIFSLALIFIKIIILWFVGFLPSVCSYYLFCMFDNIFGLHIISIPIAALIWIPFFASWGWLDEFYI